MGQKVEDTLVFWKKEAGGGGEGKCEPLIYTYVKELGAR